jgi:pyruvate kinase
MQERTNCILSDLPARPRRRKLGQRKNMNLQGVHVDIPVLTKKDIEDVINFGCMNDMDFIAASFVQVGPGHPAPHAG